MAVPELQPGEAITRTRFNNVVKATNKLEDANNLQAYVRVQGSYYNSLDDLVLVQGMYISITDNTPDSWFGRVSFPKPFSRSPVVTTTLAGSSAGKVVSFVENQTATDCVVRVQLINAGTPWPSGLICNLIAIGPANSL